MVRTNTSKTEPRPRFVLDLTGVAEESVPSILKEVPRAHRVFHCMNGTREKDMDVDMNGPNALFLNGLFGKMLRKAAENRIIPFSCLGFDLKSIPPGGTLRRLGDVESSL